MKGYFFIASVGLGLIALAPMTHADDFSHCRIFRDSTVFQVGNFYMQGSAHAFYEESNGIPWLQRYSTFCDDGRYYPSDTCIIPGEAQNLAWTENCVLDYVDSKAA